MFQVRIYGDPVLRKTARKIEVFDEMLKRFVEEMTETMKVADGVGLAATQVGDERMVAVIDISAGEEPPLVLINPEFTWKSDETEECDEGCLSLPEITLPVKRPSQVSVVALDAQGKGFTIDKADGLLARALQHEIDHLHGILFIDHVSSLQRAMIGGKLRRLAKTGRAEG
jgi:peptide deformylase